MFLVCVFAFFLMIFPVSLICWWICFWFCVFLLFAFFSICWKQFSLFPLASYSSFTFESLHASFPITCRYTNIFWLVVSTHLKNICQLGWLNMVIFYSYVSLPEGTYVFPNNEQPTKKNIRKTTAVTAVELWVLFIWNLSERISFGIYHPVLTLL